MMDLYTAIDLLNEYIFCCEEHDRAFSTPTDEELEAMKICLEASKDKAGV